MLASILITLREGLEAFLIVGILLGYLKKINRPSLGKYVWGGMVMAILVSIGVAFLFRELAILFTGEKELIFEIVTSLFAVCVLTWMVLWMQRQAKTIKSELEHRVDMAIYSGHIFALASLSFISVFREGLETVLFLGVLAKDSGSGFIIGAIGGLVIAGIIAYLVFKSAIRFNLRWFFLITGSLLILIAGGLIAHAVEDLQELGVLPILLKEIWNTNSFIDEEGFLGSILHAFVGYDGNPSLLEIIAYIIYVGTFTMQFIKMVKPKNPLPSIDS